MTDLPTLKIKSLVNFPPNAFGRAGITVAKEAGAFYVDIDYSKFSILPLPPDLNPYNFLLWNNLTNIYQLASFAASPFAPINSPVFGGDPQAPTPAPGDNDTSIATTAYVMAAVNVVYGINRIVTAAGPVVVTANDRAVAINKTVGAPTTVTLPLAPSKNGPVLISDFKRDAGTNNITITPTAPDLIQGLATLTLAANGTSVQLFPIPGVGYSL
jgi:hypothetical protein